MSPLLFMIYWLHRLDPRALHYLHDVIKQWSGQNHWDYICEQKCFFLQKFVICGRLFQLDVTFFEMYQLFFYLFLTEILQPDFWRCDLINFLINWPIKTEQKVKEKMVEAKVWFANAYFIFSIKKLQQQHEPASSLYQALPLPTILVLMFMGVMNSNSSLMGCNTSPSILWTMWLLV